MAIWTHAEFLAQVHNHKKKPAPSSLAGVCEALDDYHGALTNLAEYRLVKLFVVYKEVKHWLKEHPKAPFGSFFRHSAEKSWKAKKAAVTMLQARTLFELEAHHPGLRNALADYEDRKAKTAAAHGAAVKGLQPGYAMERQTYLAGGKSAAPTSGSTVQAVMASNGDKTFAAISEADFAKQAAAIKGAAQMYWCTKEQRLRNRISYDANRAEWVGIDKKTIHHPCAPGGTIGDENGLRPYAMDRYGNVFVDMLTYQLLRQAGVAVSTKNNTAVLKNRGIVNHSSICAGREVICAGNLFIWKGQLVHIDNNSGHYAPNEDHLRNLVQQLVDDTGLDTSYVRVQFQTAHGCTLFKANTFLAGGQPDWPDQDLNKDHTPIFRRLGATV